MDKKIVSHFRNNAFLPRVGWLHLFLSHICPLNALIIIQEKKNRVFPRMWNCSFKAWEQSVAVRCLQVSPCLQVKGQISAEQQCQSSPSCQCGRRCQPSLGWRKHPAETWALSAVQAACVWTYTQGRLESRGQLVSDDIRRQKARMLNEKYKKRWYFTASVKKQQHFLRQDLDISLLQLLHDHIAVRGCVTDKRHTGQ